MQTFTIEGRFWSLNQLIAASKTHWSQYSEQEKGYRHMVWAAARSANLHAISKPCIVRMWFYEKDLRRDIDGVMAAAAKPILDGLQDANVLPEDNREWVIGIEGRFPPPDKDNPRVVIEILEEE